jgi:hypothetical protein
MVLSSTKGTKRCDCPEHPTMGNNIAAARIFTFTPGELSRDL